MAQKKILLVGSIPPPYHGSSIYFSNLLNSRIRNEFETFHLDTSDHRNLDNLSKFEFTNIKLAIKNIFQLRKMLKKVKPDIVYTAPAANFLPYIRDGLFILTASYFSDAKIIIHLHGGNYFRNEFYNKSNIFVRHFIKKSLGKVSMAIVLSPGLETIFKGLVENVVSIPNGTDFGAGFSESEIKKESHRIKKVNYLGNLFESKGVVNILKAVRKVIEKNKNVEFNFAGDWSGREKNTKQLCMEIIEKDKIKEYVNFHGVVSGIEKENFLKGADVFIFPTSYPFEGFPLVLIEAMAAGCPVISTGDVGAINDIVINGETGILIEKNNADQISESVLELLGNDSLRIAMSKKARQRYENNFTMERNISLMIEAFNKVAVI